MPSQLQLLYQPPQLLSILQVNQLVHLLRRPLYRGLVSDPLQTHFRPLELQLQPGLVRIVIPRLVKEHGLKVEPDAVGEVEGGRGGQEDQVHQGLRLLTVPSQVEGTQLRDVELQVGPLGAREIRVHTHSLQVFNRGQVVCVQPYQQCQWVLCHT